MINPNNMVDVAKFVVDNAIIDPASLDNDIESKLFIINTKDGGSIRSNNTKKELVKREFNEARKNITVSIPIKLAGTEEEYIASCKTNLETIIYIANGNKLSRDSFVIVDDSKTADISDCSIDNLKVLSKEEKDSLVKRGAARKLKSEQVIEIREENMKYGGRVPVKIKSNSLTKYGISGGTYDSIRRGDSYEDIGGPVPDVKWVDKLTQKVYVLSE